MSRPERLALVDPDDQVVPVVAQCRLLKVARSSLYYREAPVSADDLAVMRRMDELHLAWPFYGSRRMTAVLRREGRPVNRKRIKRLMRIMALEAIYQQPNTSRKHPDHKVYRTLICYGVWSSTGRTRFGAPTSRISRWPGGSCIWSR
jgi:putative transposase